MTTAKQRKFNIEDYDYYVREYIKKSEEFGNPIPHSKLRKEPFNLPDARWYIKNCPNESVKTWADFVDWCGFVVKGKNPTKEKVIKLIYKLQNETNRPLMYDDFRGRGCYHPSIEMIKQYWGTINKMKEELGLEIIQESMINKQLSKIDFDKEINDIVNFLKLDGRNFITTREINGNKNWSSYWTLERMCKKYYSIGLVQYLSSFGIYFGKQGNGLNFDFEDGEHVTSQFEYMFSRYLKEHGFKYQIDYFRDVKYSNFIDGYNGNMNCDYVIHIDGKIIYIEIAGIIADYKTWYYENKVISYSKSKEQYRIKLLEKETMLKNANLHYYILFPCDLTNNNFQNILFNDNLNLKNKIESFYKNNIDWNKVRSIGELDYSQNVIRDFKKYSEKQKEAV